MEKKGMNDQLNLRAIERRGKWFKKRVKEEKMMARAEEKIDAYFSEDESGRAYAMFLDMLTNSYPFIETTTFKDGVDLVRKNYGFDWVEIEIIGDIIDELADEFPDEFTSENDENKNKSKE